jgi:hypothetical protein
MQIRGERPCATAHGAPERILPALASPARRRPRVRETLLTCPRTQQHAESVLVNSLLGLRYWQETAQPIEPSGHRNSLSFNNRQNLAKRVVNKPENFQRPRAQQAPYLPRLRRHGTDGVPIRLDCCFHVSSRMSSSGSSSMSRATANALRSCFSFANESTPI